MGFQLLPHVSHPDPSIPPDFPPMTPLDPLRLPRSFERSPQSHYYLHATRVWVCEPVPHDDTMPWFQNRSSQTFELPHWGES